MVVRRQGAGTSGFDFPLDHFQVCLCGESPGIGLGPLGLIPGEHRHRPGESENGPIDGIGSDFLALPTPDQSRKKYIAPCGLARQIGRSQLGESGIRSGMATDQIRRRRQEW
jgi:hypothetical protein